MLVKALRLRYLGHRIPADVLRQAVPLVGELSYEERPHKQQSMSCLLMPIGGHTEPIVQLFACRMRIEKRGLLIRGTEDVWHRKHRDSYTQTLWAWPIPPEAMTFRVVHAPTTSVMDDLREAMR
jgi:hypothetical protein